MEIREEKAAIIGIFIKDFDAVPKVNGILHDYAEDIIGRIGIPCRDRDLHVISKYHSRQDQCAFRQAWTN